MTSLGNYASASVLKCNNMICNTLTANNLKSIYGQFELSQITIAVATYTTIGNWTPTTLVKGVSVQAGTTGNEKFYVSEAGVYEIDMNLRVGQGATDMTRVDTRLLLYPSASIFAGSVMKVSTATDMSDFTSNNTAHIEITDPLNEYFEIEAKVDFTSSTPYFQTDYTRVFIKKIA
jgi:hypothetical protein